MRLAIKITVLSTCLISSTLLSGCATNTQSTLPQRGDLTMAQIYNLKTGDISSSQDGVESNNLNQYVPIKTQPNYAGYTRTAQNEIQNQFKVLANPNIPLYIFPHLSEFGNTEAPIPGYTTNFLLYEKNNYAMPNELY